MAVVVKEALVGHGNLSIVVCRLQLILLSKWGFPFPGTQQSTVFTKITTGLAYTSTSSLNESRSMYWKVLVKSMCSLHLILYMIKCAWFVSLYYYYHINLSRFLFHFVVSFLFIRLDIKTDNKQNLATYHYVYHCCCYNVTIIIMLLFHPLT